MAPREKQSLPEFKEDETPEGTVLAKYDLINRAASKDMRWWFFVLLMIGMGTVAFLYTDMRAERTSMRLEITEVRNSQLKYVTEISAAMHTALMNNTRALEANTQTLNRIENRRNPE